MWTVVPGPQCVRGSSLPFLGSELGSEALEISMGRTGALKTVVSRVQKRVEPIRLTGLQGAARALVAGSLIRSQGNRHRVDLMLR